MTHSRSWDMEIGRPKVENITRGCSPSVTFSISGSSYFHVPLTTVRHLLNVGISRMHELRYIDTTETVCLPIPVASRRLS